MKRSFQFFLTFGSLQLLLILLIANPQSYAQQDSALGFFPLHTNDLWQYHYYYTDCCCNYYISVYHTEHIEGDTILPNGLQYEILESSQPQSFPTRYLRVDTVTANVYEFSGDVSVGDHLIDSLRATVGSEFWGMNGGPIQCDAVDTSTIAGMRTMVKRFTGGGIFYTLAYGLGLAKVETMAFECWAWNIHNQDLCYARINGHEYGTFVGVSDQQVAVPMAFTLEQNYPNPFNPSTTIKYELPTASHVSLIVYDILGRAVSMLVNERRNAGVHEVMFDGSRLSSGVYFYRIEAGSFVQTRKLLLVK
jgi:hypothetical protein